MHIGNGKPIADCYCQPTGMRKKKKKCTYDDGMMLDPPSEIDAIFR